MNTLNQLLFPTNKDTAFLSLAYDVHLFKTNTQHASKVSIF